MQDLNDLFYFAKVVEHGGFSAAARLLGVPKSRLSRRIAELETRLDARLLQRTTRKMALTDVGERFLRHCQAMLLEAEQAEEVVASLTVEPRGRLRVSCPTELAHAMLRPMITDFLQQYPLVQLDMILTNRRVDLREEGVDVALRVREEGDEDPTLIARVLRPAQAFLVAAPSLVEGRSILTPDDLQLLPALGGLEADRRIHHDLRDAQGNRREVVLEARLGIEDFDVRKHAVLAGLGFSMLPQMNCEAELRDGSMVRLLPDWHLPGGNLQAVYTHRRGLLPAVRAWIEHLAEAFSRHQGTVI
ncbi:LysR substrate-binding domain-containing protein [Pseudomonas sp. BN411]|uniref:LysR substrate-binding domain-containing protein n=1 Tax=Pseudomonas sp. BN411 TaxID=2567887 RepID=UPI002458FC75|nr:LysR substrate-binding domain-containing protein [Pseudomonas sp. BN411]MDH4564152.1 LysR family transcriptional regulator [Pseudomonas sp. BN411]